MLADSLGFPLEALGVSRRRGREGRDEITRTKQQRVPGRDGPGSGEGAAVLSTGSRGALRPLTAPPQQGSPAPGPREPRPGHEAEWPLWR